MNPSKVDWQVYESNLIIDNHKQFVNDCYLIHDKFKKHYPNKDSTWAYRMYNVFALSSPMPLWYSLYYELSKTIRNHIDTLEPLWMQSWLNFHKEDEVLDWHNHKRPYHGYINIDPQNTTTDFKDYQIKNNIGDIYIGPGNKQHKVIVNEDFKSTRITLGFDVTDKPQDIPSTLWGSMPLI